MGRSWLAWNRKKIMKLHEVKNTVSSTGLTNTKTFTVEMNAMLFHSTINGIYSDKILAPMRELATNARDGHAVAGNLDVPFEVHLPSIFKPFFSVRDFGCSMTDDEIMDIYCTMFGSSKRDSNEAVGMIGLGSKAPFAYTDQFSVKCWLNNELRTYVCVLNNSGTPEISHVSTVPTSEPQGLEVSFAVQQKDVSEFNSKAKSVFFGFHPKPVLTNSNFQLENVEPIYKKNSVEIFRSEDFFGGSPYVRQGCVLYPIDFRALGMPSMNLSCIIDVPIGSVSVSTSRESLGYDGPTVTYLKNSLVNLQSLLTQFIEDDISNAPSYYDACLMYYRNRQNSSDLYYVWNQPGLLPKWQGKELRLNFNIAVKDHLGIYRSKEIEMKSEERNSIAFTVVKTKSCINRNVITMLRTCVVVEYPGCKKSSARILTLCNQEDKTYSSLIWIKVDHKDDFDALNILGGHDFIDLSTVEPTTPKKREKTIKDEVKKFRGRFIVGSTSHRTSPAVYDYFPESSETIAVEINSRTIFNPFQRYHMRFGDFERMIANLKNADVLPKEFKLVVVPTEQIEKRKCTSFFDWIETQIKKHPDYSVEILDVVTGSIPYPFSEITKKLITKDLKDLPVLENFVTYYKPLIKQNEITGTSNTLKVCIKNYFPSLVNQKALHEISKDKVDIHEVDKKYPLIRYCTSTDNLNHYLELIRK